VPRISKKITLALARWLLLGSIPLVWCLLSYYGRLGFFEERTMDWRFLYRWERPAPVKIVYVDVDSRSIEDIGNFPWDRTRFAMVAKSLVDTAHVKAVGFDFLLSPQGIPDIADPEKVQLGDLALTSFLFRPRTPPVVFAASFAAEKLRGLNGIETRLQFPYLATEQRNVNEIEPPERTSFLRQLRVNGPILTVDPPLLGFIDTVDGGMRAVPLFAETSVKTYYHLGVELARLYWGLRPDGVKIDPEGLRFERPDGTMLARIPLRSAGQVLDVNWFSGWESGEDVHIGFNKVYAYAELLESEKPEERKAAQEFFAQEEFKDAVVLVGPVDRLLQDLAATPFDPTPVPRVSIHGNIVKTIVSGQTLRLLPRWAGDGITLALTALVAALAVAGGARAVFAKIMAVLAMGVYAVVTFSLFESNLLVLPLVAPLGAAFTTSFAALTWDIIEEQRQRGRIKGLFGTYLSPELVNRMVESEQDPKLGGHEEIITAYFSDIESFSGFSEQMPPALLVELMNEYLTACTDIVQEEGGTLDKYIGDAIVAMFGAPLPLPDHAYRACIATQRVQLRIVELREKWKAEGEKWPSVVHGLRARLGLNTGPAIIGNMGSRSRFSYTMMGDNVNLAARMESGAKSLGVYTMVTDSTRQACEKHGDRVVFRFLDRIIVKGRTQPVPVHQIVCLRENLTDRRAECLDLFAQGIARYLEQDWDGAIALFQQSYPLEFSRAGTYPIHEVTPSSVFLGRCADMKKNPPGRDWDGVFKMKEK
jgi:adenylate cyclase